MQAPRPAAIVAWIAGAVAVVWTGPELHRRAQIHGWMGGGVDTTAVILHAGDERIPRWWAPPFPGHRYWLSWTDDPARRISVSRFEWLGTAIGDRVGLRRVGGAYYLRDGAVPSVVWAFALVPLFVLELLVFMIAVWWMRIRPRPERP